MLLDKYHTILDKIKNIYEMRSSRITFNNSTLIIILVIFGINLFIQYNYKNEIFAKLSNIQSKINMIIKKENVIKIPIIYDKDKSKDKKKNNLDEYFTNLHY